MRYPVNEIFYSIQGEANFAGLPAVFIRLQGCNVGCAFCDTKHTWKLDTNLQITTLQVISKVNDAGNWAYFSIEELVQEVLKYASCQHVVLTGGEPALYDLRPLITVLEERGYQIQIETSGTCELLISKNTWVTLSPKIDMPGNKEVLSANISRANEIKMPVGKRADIEKLKTLLANHAVNTGLIWLQPLSCKDSPTKLCFAEALANNWRLSVQTHKFLNVR